MKRKRLWIVLCALTVACSVSGVGLSAGIWQENRTGCKVWNAYPEPGETFTWDGPCKDGFVHGNGILEWFLKGKFKVRYEGLVVAGKREGKATMRYADGDRYIGDFVASERTGKGIYYFSNGNRYEGDFVNGRREGQGVFFFANGERYEGAFQSQRFHGQGKFYDAKGNLTHKGRWESGNYVGP